MDRTKVEKNPLFRNKGYIDGQWVLADDGTTFPVHNPSTGALLAHVPKMGRQETKRAIESADQALPAWRAKTAKERGSLLLKWNDLILQHIEDLAALITLEQGKPFLEAQGEIRYGTSFMEWFAEEAKRIYGDIIPSAVPHQHLLVIRQPIGVVAAITPWNFPCAMITRKCAPALAAGCTILVKPAEGTPLTALALAELASKAGIPPGVFNVLTGDPAAIGEEMTAHPQVRKLTFTGSTKVGKMLMAKSASTVKKLSLELGGSAPFIVFADANLDAAVQGLISSKFRNSGQTCICADRIFIEETVFDIFVKKLTAAVSALQIGDGFEAGVQIGPLINEAAVDKIERHIQDALSKGAQLACGGKRHARGGTFFEPTVLYRTTPSMQIMQEESFGPVAPLMSFSLEEEAITLANATNYGLASYFYSQDPDRIWHVAEQLDFGMVSVNGGLFSNEVAPFGGVKESGLGREGSKYGIDEYLEMKYICMTSTRST